MDACLCATDKAHTKQEILSMVDKIIGTSIITSASLMSAGLDSVAATEFARTLSERFDVELPTTLLFEHPSVDAIFTYIEPFAHVQTSAFGNIICP